MEQTCKEYISPECAEVMDTITSEGFEAYLVGGAVRDIVMGNGPHDFDVTTDALPEQVRGILEKHNIKIVDTGIKHGTVTAVNKGVPIEITTFRTDGDYKDSRHPESVGFVRSVEEDCLRRDFTMNALYLGKDGKIRDITGGISDIENKTIRAVGDPKKRFSEDALRILRAVRFAAQTGFKIEENTKAAMLREKDNLQMVSAERKGVEFIKTVTGKFASDAIRDNLEIIGTLIPELLVCKGFDQHSKFHNLDVLEHTLAVLENIPNPKDKEIATAALFHDLGKPSVFYMDENGRGHMKGHPDVGAKIAEERLNQLRAPKAFTGTVVKLVKLHDTFVKPEQYEVHKFLSEITPEFFDLLAVLQEADIKAHSPLGLKRLNRLEAIKEIANNLREENKIFDVHDLKIDGNDVMQTGAEGPQIKEKLNTIFDMYMRGEVSNDRDDLLAKLKDL